MPTRRTTALHLHRASEPGATYFVTCCTQEKKSGLTQSAVSKAISLAVQSNNRQGDTATLAFTLMSDHCHWLFSLGFRLSLGRVLARFKAQTNQALSAGAMNWQRDFFEHGLKADETGEPYALYIFLNPYRAVLINPDEVWPHWWCPDPARFAFTAGLNPNGSPPVEWIGQPVPAHLRVGE